MIPEDLTERLSKADGHLNAADRRLWDETERAMWSAHQAVARLAEVWFRLDGSRDALPLVEKYLPREAMAGLLADFTPACENGPLAAAWRDVTAAEAAILAEPLDEVDRDIKDALEAGRARKGQYLAALRGLKHAVEKRVAERYITLRAGDWFRLHDGQIGRLVALDGLSAHFLLPRLAEESAAKGMRAYGLGYARLEAVARPDDMPLGSPAYHWLREAGRRRCAAWKAVAADPSRGFDVYGALDAALDAAAKAWWASAEPAARRAPWSYSDARHIDHMPGIVPTDIREPLQEALARTQDLYRAAIAAGNAVTAVMRDEAQGVLDLLDRALAALEEHLDQEIELTPGEWVSIPDRGRGRLILRAGRFIVVDLGRQGVVAGPLLLIPLRHAATPVEAEAAAADPPHTRWLWFACHPQAWCGRTLCPCCGLPGVLEDGAACDLCGWRHDGGSFDPHRPNWLHDGLDLALARRRFQALGHAVPPAGPPSRRRLVAALDDLASHDAADDGERNARIEELWRSHARDTTLAPVGTPPGVGDLPDRLEQAIMQWLRRCGENPAAWPDREGRFLRAAPADLQDAYLRIAGGLRGLAEAGQEGKRLVAAWVSDAEAVLAQLARPDRHTGLNGAKRIARGTLQGCLDVVTPGFVLAQFGGGYGRWARGGETPGLFDFGEPSADGRGSHVRKGLLLPLSLCRDPGLRDTLGQFAALLVSASRDDLAPDAVRRRLALQDWLDGHGLDVLRLMDEPPTTNWLRFSLKPAVFPRLLNRFDYVTAMLDGPAQPSRILEHAPFRWPSHGEFLDWCLDEDLETPLYGFQLHFAAKVSGVRSILDGGARTRLLRPPSYWASFTRPDPDAVCVIPTIRLTQEPADYGWITLEIGLGDQTAIVMLSDVYDPLPTLLDWLQAVAAGDLPIGTIIDEEGPETMLVAHGLDDDRLIVAVLDRGEEATRAAALVRRAAFLAAWRAELSRFLRDEMDPDRWRCDGDDEDGADPRGYVRSLMAHDFLAGT